EIVATERVLASGFDERVHDWWPGLDEVRGVGVGDGGLATPRLMVPAAPPGASHANPESPSNPRSPIPNPAGEWWTFRDREEELVAIARQVRANESAGESVPLARTAAVFKRPLPYLYAADEVFRSAGIPFHASDALPLAAEPTSAALDLVLDAVAS